MNTTKKNYTVAIKMKEQTILKKEFNVLSRADEWALKMVRTILICGCPATITDNRTGEILATIER